MVEDVQLIPNCYVLPNVTFLTVSVALPIQLNPQLNVLTPWQMFFSQIIFVPTNSGLRPSFLHHLWMSDLRRNFFFYWVRHLTFFSSTSTDFGRGG